MLAQPAWQPCRPAQHRIQQQRHPGRALPHAQTAPLRMPERLKGRQHLSGIALANRMTDGASTQPSVEGTAPRASRAGGARSGLSQPSLQPPHDAFTPWRMLVRQL